MFVKDVQAPNRRADCKKFAAITGLKTFNSCPAFLQQYSHIIHITWAQTIVNASHCVGFTFPGMIEEPGSFSGMILNVVLRLTYGCHLQFCLVKLLIVLAHAILQ
jgi:hypothetical protein